MPSLAALDQKHVWHPFTQMRDWLRQAPTVIVAGKGAVLRDANGRRYLDANSSIWTNLHGHQHPRINAAIKRQLGKIAHSSALGLTNEPATLLAARLVEICQAHYTSRRRGHSPSPLKSPVSPANHLQKVFFSDDGSTALEVALKLAYEYTRRTFGKKSRPRFLSLEGAYHGDTVGAVSLGHIDLFHKAYGGLLFQTDKVMSPYCYRCPFNRARPEREDAREYRRCRWECVGTVEKKFSATKKTGRSHAAFIFEPLMQGAAGMIPQPAGWLKKVCDIARGHGSLLIADEVMTAFGRTGIAPEADESNTYAAVTPEQALLFATARAGVQPDFLCVAKGLTGGYLPMAATLTTQKIFDAFLGEYGEFKTFFHGHSFTGNQLGAAASLASLGILQGAKSVQARANLEKEFDANLKGLWRLPQVGDIRRVGLIAGVELVKDWRTREPYPLVQRTGIRVCDAMARRGVLTRPVGNVIVLMPPYCTTSAQLGRMVESLSESVKETL